MPDFIYVLKTCFLNNPLSKYPYQADGLIGFFIAWEFFINPPNEEISGAVYRVRWIDGFK